MKNRFASLVPTVVGVLALFAIAGLSLSYIVPRRDFLSTWVLTSFQRTTAYQVNGKVPQGFVTANNHVDQHPSASEYAYRSRPDYDFSTVPPPVFEVIESIILTPRPRKLHVVCEVILGKGCGGLSDRFKGVQTLLHLAAITDRQLIIHGSIFNSTAPEKSTTALSGALQQEVQEQAKHEENEGRVLRLRKIDDECQNLAIAVLSAVEETVIVQNNCAYVSPEQENEGRFPPHKAWVSGKHVLELFDKVDVVKNATEPNTTQSLDILHTHCTTPHDCAVAAVMMSGVGKDWMHKAHVFVTSVLDAWFSPPNERIDELPLARHKDEPVTTFADGKNMTSGEFVGGGNASGKTQHDEEESTTSGPAMVPYYTALHVRCGGSVLRVGDAVVTALTVSDGYREQLPQLILDYVKELKLSTKVYPGRVALLSDSARFTGEVFALAEAYVPNMLRCCFPQRHVDRTMQHSTFPLQEWMDLTLLSRSSLILASSYGQYSELATVLTSFSTAATPRTKLEVVQSQQGVYILAEESKRLLDQAFWGRAAA